MRNSTFGPSRQRSLEIFMADLVDYAGMFPPASLSLERAIQNFARYRTDPDRWILGPFVCPASRLRDLYAYSELLEVHPAHPLSVLAPPSGDLADWSNTLETTKNSIDDLDRQLGDVARVAAVELKLPRQLASSDALLAEALSTLYECFAPGQYAFDFFIEIVPAAGAEVVATVARHLQHLDHADGRRRAAMKIRTGGVTPESIPDATSVADFICACRDTSIRFKATAGLHHPLRHFSKDVGTEMHGFLNVFAGAMAAAEHDLDRGAVVDLLLDPDIQTFTFTAAGLEVNELFVPNDRIAEMRSDFAVSFGSCSFDDPRDDLRKLELL